MAQTASGMQHARLCAGRGYSPTRLVCASPPPSQTPRFRLSVGFRDSRHEPSLLSRGFEKLSQHPSYDPSSEAKAAEEPKAANNEADITNDKAGPIRVQATRGGKGGKTVTAITGIPSDQLKPLCKKLKAQCGAGGKVRGDTLEIQGDHTQKLVETLQAMGFKDTKKSGG